ncbi:protocadherin beta-5-like [Mya arenaria]|uniref:protocadherin beta-5-like n=1 Tax=Mya arenaria TaxID=6604 RepID=UPI0022E80819|nr:protocadherin beta-5-like [Mya arenaria]
MEELSGDTNTDFAVAKTTGVIRVAAGKTLSKATTATYALVVKAVDTGATPLTGTTTVSVTVGNCSSTAVTGWTAPAPIASPSGSANATAVVENVAEGTTLFIATAIGAATYSLTSNAGGKGAINSTTGFVTLAKGQFIDYESTPSLKFVVVAIAKTGANGTATITLPITDVNEAPEFSSATINACINDNSAAGLTLGTYTATDPDAGNTITYAIVSGNTNTDFAVTGTTGVITVATGKTIFKATTATYGLVVNAVDSAGPKMTGTTTVSVTIGGCSGTGYVRVLMSLMIAAIVATQLF